MRSANCCYYLLFFWEASLQLKDSELIDLWGWAKDVGGHVILGVFVGFGLSLKAVLVLYLSLDSFV